MQNRIFLILFGMLHFIQTAVYADVLNKPELIYCNNFVKDKICHSITIDFNEINLKSNLKKIYAAYEVNVNNNYSDEVKFYVYTNKLYKNDGNADEQTYLKNAKTRRFRIDDSLKESINWLPWLPVSPIIGTFLGIIGDKDCFFSKGGINFPYSLIAYPVIIPIYAISKVASPLFMLPATPILSIIDSVNDDKAVKELKIFSDAIKPINTIAPGKSASFKKVIYKHESEIPIYVETKETSKIYRIVKHIR
jgi:hypothetical protein